MGGYSRKTCEIYLIVPFFSGENKKEVQGRKMTRQSRVSCDEDKNSNERQFEVSPDGSKSRLNHHC